MRDWIEMGVEEKLRWQEGRCQWLFPVYAVGRDEPAYWTQCTQRAVDGSRYCFEHTKEQIEAIRKARELMALEGDSDG